MAAASSREPTLLDERRHRAAAEPRRSRAAAQRPRAAGAGGAAAASPDLPHVACFDTAFHAGIPDEAALYALPIEWIERHGLRRFGFHGISHAWASRRAAELLGRPLGELRLVTCHLGAGASLAAVRAGRSVDTTMGFTPNEGLVMATRSGSVDPGLLLWLSATQASRRTSSSRPWSDAPGCAGSRDSATCASCSRPPSTDARAAGRAGRVRASPPGRRSRR